MPGRAFDPDVAALAEGLFELLDEALAVPDGCELSLAPEVMPGISCAAEPLLDDPAAVQAANPPSHVTAAAARIAARRP